MALIVTGNLVCDNGRDGIFMAFDGNTVTDNDVGAGTADCLPNARTTGYDLFDREAGNSEPVDLVIEFRSTWRNNYTEGDTFNQVGSVTSRCSTVTT